MADHLDKASDLDNILAAANRSEQQQQDDDLHASLHGRRKDDEDDDGGGGHDVLDGHDDDGGGSLSELQSHHSGHKRARDDEGDEPEDDDELDHHKRQAMGDGLKPMDNGHAAQQAARVNAGHHQQLQQQHHQLQLQQQQHHLQQQQQQQHHQQMQQMPMLQQIQQQMGRPLQPISGPDLSAVAATLAPVLSAPGLAPVATPLHEKMQDPHFSQLMATWPEQLRRYAKRPQARRRGSQELSEQERWYCPLQCGKYYKTTSTRSIAKHKSNCPKLPASTNPPPDYLQQQQKKDNSLSRSSATAATALNPSAANALATAAAMGLLRIPPGSAPIMPFPFPMLNPQLMLQILQNNPQANATLQAAAAAAAAGQQQQMMQHHQQQQMQQQQQQQQQQHHQQE